MWHKIGTVSMALGTVLVLAALSLFLWNRWEDARAGVVIEEIQPAVEEYIETADGEENAGETSGSDSLEMAVAKIDGYEYIGYISIPALGLDLPVMSSWSYEQLKIAPCRYYGSTKTGNLVIAAHNYSRHFGNIKDLSQGDAVRFTDMEGTVTRYEVEEIDTLSPTAVEEMTDSGYALTLFTCTYGGQSRVTVRCGRVSE